MVQQLDQAQLDRRLNEMRTELERSIKSFIGAEVSSRLAGSFAKEVQGRVGELHTKAMQAAEKKLEVGRVLEAEKDKRERDRVERATQAAREKREADATAAKQRLDEQRKHAQEMRDLEKERAAQARADAAAKAAQEKKVAAERRAEEKKAREEAHAAKLASEQQLTEELRARDAKALEAQQAREKSAHAAKEAETKLALEKERKLAEVRERQATEREEKLQAIRREAETRLLREKADFEARTAEHRAMAEAKARAEVERVNEALHARGRAQQGALDKDRAIEVAQTSLRLLGDGVLRLLNDPVAGGRAVALVGVVAAAVFGAREGFKLLRSRLEAILGRPSLVRETSRKGLSSALKARLLAWANPRATVLADVVFEPKLEERLQQLARATKNTRRHQAPFRHVVRENARRRGVCTHVFVRFNLDV